MRTRTEPTPPALAPAVRPATLADLATLVEIWQELMSLHQETDSRFALAPDAAEEWERTARDIMERRDSFLLVALAGERPEGFCLGWVAQNPRIYRVPALGFISEIAVARAVQRRGIGRRLVAAAAHWFAERGLTEFQLSTATWNQPARAFWESLGGEALLVRYHFPMDKLGLARRC